MLSELLKSRRETKRLLLREVASMIDVDTALISKIKKLAVALGIEYKQLLTLWLSEKVYEDVKGEEVAVDAVKLALKRIKTEENQTPKCIN